MYKERFLFKFDELNNFGLSVIGRDKKEAEDMFVEMILNGYLEGVASANYQLSTDIKVNNNLLQESINKEYDGVSIIDKFNNYLADENVESIQRLVESEFHRSYTTGEIDTARQVDGTVLKTWVTMGDDKVRETHDYLENVTIPIDEYFVTYDGDRALAPSGFSFTENNANCRCILEFQKV